MRTVTEILMEARREIDLGDSIYICNALDYPIGGVYCEREVRAKLVNEVRRFISHHHTMDGYLRSLKERGGQKPHWLSEGTWESINCRMTMAGMLTVEEAMKGREARLELLDYMLKLEADGKLLKPED